MRHQNSKRLRISYKRRFFFYILGIFIAAKVAAHVNDADAKIQPHLTAADNDSLQQKIAAFIEGGVERKINIDHYDKDSVIQFAESLVGTPHAMGGYSSSGIDCSGLVKLAHEQFNVQLPRSSHDQARYGVIINSPDELKRGDLVFFHSTYDKDELVTHAGIYLGDNKFIHASTKRGVVVSNLRDSGYYEKHYLFATRLIE